MRRSRLAIGMILLGIPLVIYYRASLAAFALNSGSLFDRYERTADIAYGPHPRQKLDVFTKGGPSVRPIVLFWYGGAWLWGSKSDFRFVGSALADAGYVVVLPDYRLYPEARLPAVIEDGALAVRWAQDHAPEYGGDPLRIFLMGHSAGAHLAATLAYDSGHLAARGIDPRSIRGFIGLSGPYSIDKELLMVYTNVFPMPPNAERDWLPIRPVGGSSPPALLIQGTDDWMVSESRTEEFAVRLKASGVPAGIRIYEGGSHQDTVAALSRPLRFSVPVFEDVSRFLAERSKAD